MQTFNTTKPLSIIALTLSLAFSLSAHAEALTKDQYKMQSTKINADYKLAKVRCESLAGNAEDICDAEEKGKRNIARAELEIAYTPTIKTRYDLHVAKADAAYAVAMQKCDDKAGITQDLCEKEAKAAKVHAISDAKAQMSTSKVNAVATEKSVEANEKAMEKSDEARQDATADKLKADYAVAKEKCDVLAGGAKNACLSEAKIRFAQ